MHRFVVVSLLMRLTTLHLVFSKITTVDDFTALALLRPFNFLGLISFCTGMHHEYCFEVVNVLSCSPFRFENTENIQLIDG